MSGSLKGGEKEGGKDGRLGPETHPGARMRPTSAAPAAAAAAASSGRVTPHTFTFTAAPAPAPAPAPAVTGPLPPRTPRPRRPAALRRRIAAAAACRSWQCCSA